MIKGLASKSCQILFLISFLSSCYKEHVEIPNPENEAFNFVTTPAQESKINSSRGAQYEIIDPVPWLSIYNLDYSLNKFEIRGDNTLNFRRKGFSVTMDHKLEVYLDKENPGKKMKEFKLLAMVYDYTYIENMTAIQLFKEIDLWPLTTFFTEVRINNHTQGVYLIIEDPARYFVNDHNASILLRRGYYRTIKKYYPGDNLSPDSIHYYLARFEKMYQNMRLYSGKQLYDTLSAYLDIESYYKRMAINLLIKNGDYTDEVFFYTKVNSKGNKVFSVLPWDNDDIFMDEPHEIGKSWAASTLFGTRIYNSMADIKADIGDRLVFSIEDDLDYKIAKDDFLYAEYLKTLRNVVAKIEDNTIDKIFDYNETHLMPFYANNSIIAQSKYDVDSTNLQLFTVNLIDKRKFLKERRAWIIQELNKN